MMISRKYVIDLCTLHLEWDHKVDSVSNFLDESLAEISGEPNFRPFCERKKTQNKRHDSDWKMEEVSYNNIWLYEMCWLSSLIKAQVGVETKGAESRQKYQFSRIISLMVTGWARVVGSLGPAML